MNSSVTAAKGASIIYQHGVDGSLYRTLCS